MNNPAVARLFYGTRNPLAVDSLIKAIRSREPIIVTHLLPELLPATFLLATIAREWSEKPLVDDYVLLVETIKEEFAQTVPRFWHPEGHLVSFVAFQGITLTESPEAVYMANAYRELTGTFIVEQPATAKKGKGKGKKK